MWLAIVGVGVAFCIHRQLCLRNCNGDSLRFCRGIILITGVGGLHIVGAHCDGNSASCSIIKLLCAALVSIEGIRDGTSGRGSFFYHVSGRLCYIVPCNRLAGVGNFQFVICQAHRWLSLIHRHGVLYRSSFDIVRIRRRNGNGGFAGLFDGDFARAVHTDNIGGFPIMPLFTVILHCVADFSIVQRRLAGDGKGIFRTIRSGIGVILLIPLPCISFSTGQGNFLIVRLRDGKGVGSIGGCVVIAHCACAPFGGNLVIAHLCKFLGFRVFN